MIKINVNEANYVVVKKIKDYLNYIYVYTEVVKLIKVFELVNLIENVNIIVIRVNLNNGLILLAIYLNIIFLIMV